VSTKKSKQALPFKRGPSGYWADPDDLHLELDPERKHYDPRGSLPPDEAQVKFMLLHGVELPICVEAIGDQFVVVDGRRRVVNAREVKRRQLEEGVPAERAIMVPVKKVRGRTDEKRVFLNEHRRAVDPVEQARGMQRFLDQGQNEEDVADLFNVTVKTVQNRLKLLDLVPEVQAAVSKGELASTKAMKLAGKSEEKQRAALNGKPAPKTPRGTRPKRPARKIAMKAAMSKHLKDREAAVLLWALGEITTEEAVKKVPALKKAMEEE